jgi:hypothetical protein
MAKNLKLPSLLKVSFTHDERWKTVMSLMREKRKKAAKELDERRKAGY